MSYKSGSAFPDTFEFVVRKQDHLPLVKVTDYAYQAPTHSILGGPLFASPEIEIKEEQESVLLPETPTAVEESINLVYPQVLPFPHIEDYLWLDFSDNADIFFEQFEKEEELASDRSVSPRLPPTPRFDTPVDQRRTEHFQGWEFEEFDFRYVPPPVWQEPLPVSPHFPPVDLLDPVYHVQDLKKVHQDFRNFYPSPQSLPPLLEEPVDWTYVQHHILEQEIFRSGFSTPLTSDLVRIAHIHIDHSSRTQSRTLYERELTWALNSKDIDTVVRIHRREVFQRGEGSHWNYHLHSPPLPLLVIFLLLLSLIGTEVYQVALVISVLLYVYQNTLGSLHVTTNSKVSTKFVCRELVEAYRREQAAARDEQSEIERELENQENQENIPPPPAYVAPELPAANPTNQAAPRIVFGRLPLPVLPIPEEICISRDALPNRPRTPNPGFHYCYNPADFLVARQETDGPSRNTSEDPSGYHSPDTKLADAE